MTTLLVEHRQNVTPHVEVKYWEVYLKTIHHLQSHSRQSARPFLQSSELGPPAPSPAGKCVPPHLVAGWGYTLALACERGGGGIRIRTRGTDTVVLYVYVPAHHALVYFRKRITKPLTEFVARSSTEFRPALPLFLRMILLSVAREKARRQILKQLLDLPLVSSSLYFIFKKITLNRILYLCLLV
jgi:hypothetical protein